MGLQQDGPYIRFCGNGPPEPTLSKRNFSEFGFMEIHGLHTLITVCIIYNNIYIFGQCVSLAICFVLYSK